MGTEQFLLYFFANLGADATELLYAAIRNKIMKKCHTFVSYIDYLYALDGKRSFSEFITFIMGITVLKELNMEYGLEQDFSSDVVQNEISKLARNYCRGDVEKAKELVIAFIENPIFDSVEELIAYFDTVPDKYAFFSCKGTDDVYSRFSVSGARIYRGGRFYVMPASDGVSYYHRSDCPELEGSRSNYQAFDSKKQCAEFGAYPCPKCKP